MIRSTCAKEPKKYKLIAGLTVVLLHAASLRVWNSLPPSLQPQDLNYNQFKHALKTLLFN